MTNAKSTAAAKLCAELSNEAQIAVGVISNYNAIDFEPGHEIAYDAQAFREYVERVDAAIRGIHAFYNKGGSGKFIPTSLHREGAEAWAKLNSLLLSEAVDPFAEACKKFSVDRDAFTKDLEARGLKVVEAGNEG